MTANGWCFSFRDTLGPGDLYVAESELDAARTLAKKSLEPGANILREKLIPGAVREFFELKDGGVIQGRLVSS